MKKTSKKQIRESTRRPARLDSRKELWASFEAKYGSGSQKESTHATTDR